MYLHTEWTICISDMVFAKIKFSQSCSEITYILARLQVQKAGRLLIRHRKYCHIDSENSQNVRFAALCPNPCCYATNRMC